MSSSLTRYDDVDPNTVYLIPVTCDGRILAIAERRPGQSPFWSLPFARLRRPYSPPEPVARRILAAMRLEYSSLSPVTVADPADCQAAVYTATIAWTDRHPMFVGRGPHLLHALPAATDALRTLDLRPHRVLDLLLHERDGLDPSHELLGAGSR